MEGGRGKREERGATGTFHSAKIFFSLERGLVGTREEGLPVGWLARGAPRPSCELGAEQGGGGPAVLEVTSSNFPPAAATALAVSRPVAGL